MCLLLFGRSCFHQLVKCDKSQATLKKAVDDDDNDDNDNHNANIIEKKKSSFNLESAEIEI